jgi:NADH:ubiquinone oxidoreductase subunit 6 (subunit J)
VTVADALMLALGVIAVGSGALVVTSTHLVRAGLYLVISLGAIAGLYLVLGAELLAWVQILVYVGAVVVLLLFAVMLTRAPIGPSTDLDRPAGPAALIGAGVGFGLAALLADAFHWTRYDLPPTGTAERVGAQIFGGWVLPFEVLSILLLAALVGAIVLSRPDLGARPDPDAAGVPAQSPTPDPIAESAAVVSRLERIAARQANAQARLRQTAAEQRSATTTEPETAAQTTPAASTAQDVLKGKAADVIFGAQARRTRLGADTPPEPGTTRDDIIEGTATETGPRPSPGRPSLGGAATETGSSPSRAGSRPSPGRPSIEGAASETGSRSSRAGARRSSGRSSIEGAASASPPAGGRSGRAIEGSTTEGALTEGPAAKRPAGSPDATDDRPALAEGRRSPRGVSARTARPALPAGDDKAGSAGRPGSDKAGDGQSGSDKASAGRPGSDKASAGRPGSDKASDGQSGSDKASDGQAGSGQAGSDKAGSDKAGSDKDREGDA